MNTIIHDPTRGWLLLTEKWPGGEFPETMDNINLFLVHRNSCLSTAIEIAKEDWLPVIMKIKEFVFDPQDHHPYSVEAEFEVSMRPKGATHLPWIARDSRPMSFDGSMEYIARLVKAKEVDPYAQNKKQLDDLIVMLENKIKETESQERI